MEPLAQVAAAQPLEGLDESVRAISLAEQPIDAIGVHVVDAKELVSALAPVVGGEHALGRIALIAGDAANRFDLRQPIFVESDCHSRGGRRG